MMPEVGAMPKVSGSSSATPEAGPTPGQRADQRADHDADHGHHQVERRQRDAEAEREVRRRGPSEPQDAGGNGTCSQCEKTR